MKVDDFVSFDMPTDWKRVDLRHGVCFAPNSEWVNARGSPDLLHLYLFYGLLALPGAVSFEAFTVQEMKRYVPSGFPDEFAVKIETWEARVFRWTDGVNDILSYYVMVSPRLIVELSVGEGHALSMRSEDILARIDWKTGSQEIHQATPVNSPRIEDGRSYKICRQDDNGNRFLVSAGLSRREAERTLLRFDSLSHKQTYWISREG